MWLFNVGKSILDEAPSEFDLLTVSKSDERSSKNFLTVSMTGLPDYLSDVSLTQTLWRTFRQVISIRAEKNKFKNSFT